MSKTTAFLALGAELLSLAACGNPSISKHDGAVFVEQHAVEDMRIDGMAHDLTAIGWLGARPDGGVAVMQAMDRRVLVYDNEGRVRLSVGQAGDGPGEFRQIVHAGLIGDSLWVYDGRSRITSIVGLDGVLKGSVGPPRNLALDIGATVQQYLPGPVQAVYGDGSRLLVAYPATQEGPREHRLVRLSGDGSDHRLVVTLPHDRNASVSKSTTSGVFGSVVPFAHRSQWAVAPDGSKVAVASSNVSDSGQGHVALSVYDSAGNQYFTWSMPVTAVRVPEALKDSAIDALAQGKTGDIRRLVLSEIKDLVPHVYSPVRGVIIARDGRVWIGVRAVGRANSWFVVNEDGSAVCVVDLPPGLNVRAATERHIWAVEQNEFDVQSVVRLLIQPSSHESHPPC